MNQDIYLSDSNNNIQFLKDTVTGIDDHLYHIAPAEGKWSIQLILEHLAITESVVLNLSKGPTTETDRDPTSKVHIIKTAFNDHQKVYPNPKPVTPIGSPHSIEEFLATIRNNRSKFLEDMQSKGTHHILDLFPHPLTGKMTRLEWLYFSIYHTERHIHQIKMIKQNPLLKSA